MVIKFNRHISRVCLLVIVILFFSPIISAQETSDNQRIGHEDKTEWELSAGADTSVYAQSGKQTCLFYGTLQGSVSLTLEKTWLCSITVPLSLQYIQGEYVRYPFTWNPGDSTVTAGWMGRVSNMRFQASAICTIPTGTAQPSYPEGSTLVTGSGQWSLGLFGRVSWIIDPVVAGVSLAYFVGLPKQERYGASWSPCTLSLKTSVTEVLNSLLGYTVVLGQTIKAPDILNGKQETIPWLYSASLEAYLWFGTQNTYWTFGALKTITSIMSPLIITAGFTYTWRSKNKS